MYKTKTIANSITTTAIILFLNTLFLTLIASFLNRTEVSFIFIDFPSISYISIIFTFKLSMFPIILCRETVISFFTALI